MRGITLIKILLAITVVFVLNQQLFSQGVLNLKGNVKDAIATETYIDSSNIVVFKGTLRDTTAKITLGNNGKYHIVLQLNTEYTIKFSAASYTAKRVYVNTSLPDDKKLKRRNEKEWNSSLNVALFERIEGVDYSALSQPFAKIKFREYDGEEYFSYDIVYHKKVKDSFENIANSISKVKAKKAEIEKEIITTSDEAKKKIIESAPDKSDAIKLVEEANKTADSIKRAADERAELIRKEALEYKERTEVQIQKTVDSLISTISYVEDGDDSDAKARARQIIFLATQEAKRIIADAERKADDILNNAGIKSNVIVQKRITLQNDFRDIKNKFQNSGFDKLKQKDAIKKGEEFISSLRMGLAQEKYYLELEKLKAKTREDSMLIEKREKEIKDREDEIKEFERQLQDMKEEIIRKDYEMKKSKYMLISALVVLAILAIFLIYYVFVNIKIKKLNRLLAMQKQDIEDKNNKIMSSLAYARRIQEAFLPPPKIFNKYFDNSFILFLPKDVVSGDFYWLEKYNNKTYFSVIDCTGHGVPGAFMSIIGNLGLNKSLKELKKETTGEILNSLSNLVSDTLSTAENEFSVKDGMDLALCALNEDRTEVEFSGAFNPLYIVRQGHNEMENAEDENNLIPLVKTDTHSLFEIKSNKSPIGGLHKEGELYTTHRYKVQKGDTLYVFSDGYIDQFGGENGKKFRFKQFRELLLTLHNLPMDKQQSILKKRLIEWIGTEYEQIDDVCIMGVRV